MRSAIIDALQALIASGVDGSNYSNLYGNVSSKNLHFDQIPDFPYCTLTPGTSIISLESSGIKWKYLDVYIRLYVKSEGDAQAKLELLIADIENIIDSNLQLEYTITKASGDTLTGYTTDSTVRSITTDEGILAPIAFGEITVQIRYQNIQRRL